MGHVLDVVHADNRLEGLISTSCLATGEAAQRRRSQVTSYCVSLTDSPRMMTPRRAMWILAQ
jgi:hypothetical protein